MSADSLLLVEDDDATREVLTLLLDAEGWSVAAVQSGEAALHYLRSVSRQPEVVLSDLHLPGLDGAALADALRPLLHGACLLGMSASEPGEGGERYDAVLRKPFEPAEVRLAVVRVRAMLNEAHTPAQVDDAGRTPDEEEGTGAAGKARDLPVIAMETFFKLERQMGARAKELYAFALADAGDRLRRMEQSLSGDNLRTYHAEAHALKGSAGMIGAQRLHALASWAETESGTGDGEEARSEPRNKNIAQMHLACDEIRLMLETLFPI